mmetsp:Transcript_40968/g.30139  ORF Transcript_40968/g.30139 Transcript_40968/m.30139 type:complete len:81 (+) Transcript_40968:453-695(+)
MVGGRPLQSATSQAVLQVTSKNSIVNSTRDSLATNLVRKSFCNGPSIGEKFMPGKSKQSFLTGKTCGKHTAKNNSKHRLY